MVRVRSIEKAPRDAAVTTAPRLVKSEFKVKDQRLVRAGNVCANLVHVDSFGNWRFHRFQKQFQLKSDRAENLLHSINFSLPHVIPLGS